MWSKYRVQKKQIYQNGGWVDTDPLQTRTGEKIGEYDSFSGCSGSNIRYRTYTYPISEDYICDECSTSGPKWIATYSGGRISSAECDSSISLVKDEIQLDGLLSVEIGDCVNNIAQGTFSFCDSLSSVTMSDSVTTINNGAFQACSNLKSVTLSENLTSIGSMMFYHCSGLTSIIIPDNVTTVRGASFMGCSSLSSVTIGNNVETIGIHTFYGCSSLTSIVIPNSVTSIGEYAFIDCCSLTSVTIGTGITFIGNSVFYKNLCSSSSLQSITILATSPPALEDNGEGHYQNFNGSDCPIYVPSGSVNAYKTTTGWSTYASRITAIT